MPALRLVSLTALVAVAAALAEEVSIYAWHGMSKEEFYWAIERTLEEAQDELERLTARLEADPCP